MFKVVKALHKALIGKCFFLFEKKGKTPLKQRYLNCIHQRTHKCQSAFNLNGVLNCGFKICEFI